VLAGGALGGGELPPSSFVYICCSGMELWCRDERPVTDVRTSHGVAEMVLYVQLSSVKLDCSCFLSLIFNQFTLSSTFEGETSEVIRRSERTCPSSCRLAAYIPSI